MADITEAGIAGIAVGGGSFANNDASILFFSRNLLLATKDWEPLGLDSDSNADGNSLFVRLSGGWSLSLSEFILLRFRPPELWLSGDFGESRRKPVLDSIKFSLECRSFCYK